MELRTMEQMIPEYLEPCLRKGKKYKGLCKAARAERDFETMEAFAPIPVIQKAGPESHAGAAGSGCLGCYRSHA